jgi:hypothetical protein
MAGSTEKIMSKLGGVESASSASCVRQSETLKPTEVEVAKLDAPTLTPGFDLSNAMRACFNASNSKNSIPK